MKTDYDIWLSYHKYVTKNITVRAFHRIQKRLQADIEDITYTDTIFSKIVTYCIW